MQCLSHDLTCLLFIKSFTPGLYNLRALSRGSRIERNYIRVVNVGEEVVPMPLCLGDAVLVVVAMRLVAAVFVRVVVGHNGVIERTE